jgi:GNAT superfamily N-acetyltransferase
MSTYASRSGLPPLSVGDLSDELPSSYPHELVEVVEVANGQRVTVRPVLPLDAAKFQAFVTGLSKTSRAHRFMGGLREIPPPLLQRLTRIDYRSHMALVAETRRDGMPIIIAEARYAVEAGSDSAELAVAVADEWQGLGLAKALLRHLIGHAAELGLRRLHGETLASNACIMHLAWRAGFSIRPVPGVAGVLQLARNIASESPLASEQTLEPPAEQFEMPEGQEFARLLFNAEATSTGGKDTSNAHPADAGGLNALIRQTLANLSGASGVALVRVTTRLGFTRFSIQRGR